MDDLGSQSIIDLTDSFSLNINWPSSSNIIELDDSIVLESPQVTSSNNDCSSRHTDSIILIDENRISPGIKRKKKLKRNRNSTTSQLEKPESNYRDRSPINFGNCPICFDTLGKNPLASTKCGHVFCFKCLEQTLRIEKKCPTCRQQLRGSTAYHPLYLSRG